MNGGCSHLEQFLKISLWGFSRTKQIQFRFGTILLMVSLPALRHLKVSIFLDMCKHFNTFNNRIPTMLKVLIPLAVPKNLLTFQSLIES